MASAATLTVWIRDVASNPLPRVSPPHSQARSPPATTTRSKEGPRTYDDGAKRDGRENDGRGKPTHEFWRPVCPCLLLIVAGSASGGVTRWISPRFHRSGGCAVDIRRWRASNSSSREIGPVDVDEHELGIGQLPEQEIRQAQFSTGADQQIRIGEIGGVEISGEALGGHLGRSDDAFLGHVLGDASARRGRSRRGRRS